jgi:hypothetical protein
MSELQYKLVLALLDQTRGESKYNSFFFFFLITDFIALIAVNNLLDIQRLPNIPSC